MRHRLHIVHVCRVGWPHVGGMESVVRGLSTAQVERGHRVDVITLRRAITDDAVLPDAVVDGVRYHRLRRVGPRRYPLALGLPQKLRGAQVAHVHGLDGLADVAVAARSWHGARVGITTHGGFWHHGQSALKRWWMGSVTRRTLQAADAVWFPSKADERRLEALGVFGKLIPNGVEIERFQSVRREPEPGRWVVLGRVDEHKGIDDLLRTLGSLAQMDARPFSLDIIGPSRDPRLVDSLGEVARRHGLADRVAWRGEVAEGVLAQELARCELALFPSRYEGFGLAVVEAMAAGIPVVVSPIEPFAELVTPEREGWRVDFTQHRAAASQIARLWGTDLSAVGAAARSRASTYSWRHRVLAWEEAYRAMGDR